MAPRAHITHYCSCSHLSSSLEEELEVLEEVVLTAPPGPVRSWGCSSSANIGGVSPGLQFGNPPHCMLPAELGSGTLPPEWVWVESLTKGTVTSAGWEVVAVGPHQLLWVSPSLVSGLPQTDGDLPCCARS